MAEEWEDYFLDCIDIIEESIDKNDYRKVLVPIIFYKAVSDTFQSNFKEALDETGDEELAKDKAYHDIVVPEGFEWSELLNQTSNSDEFIDNALQAIRQKNPELEGLFSTNFLRSDVGHNELMKLAEHLDTRNLSVEETSSEDLSSGYKTLVKEFAKHEDRDAGDFYEPQGIIDVLVGILEPFDSDSDIHDPVAGSADLLIAAYRHYVGEQDGSPGSISISGQESINGGRELATTNFFLNNMYDVADIRSGDLIKNPQFATEQELDKFDCILTNFPFGEDWEKKSYGYGRFDWTEKLPAKDKSDYCYIMHMVEALKSDGKLASVVSHGVLFRENEEKFRKPMIENDWVEAVIGMPEKLFGEDNDIAPAILVLNKDKPEERQDEVFFLHANDEEFYRELNNKNEMTQKGVNKILENYKNSEEEERVSEVVCRDEIRENDYQLNISLYVDTTEPEEPIDTIKESRKLLKLEEELSEIKERKDSHLREIYGEKFKEVEEEIKGEA